jgi:thioredoxin-like negative regulator of GroEL
MLAQADLFVPGFPGEPLTRETLGTRCFVMHALTRSLDPICKQLLTEGGRKPLPLSYVERLLERGDEEDAPRTRMAMAASLVEHGQVERALFVLDGLEKSLGGDPQYQLMRVDLLLRLGREVPDEALVRLYRDGPLNPGVRRVLARASARRGLDAAALAHLEYLRGLGPLSSEDQALRESLRQKLAGGEAP